MKTRTALVLEPTDAPPPQDDPRFDPRYSVERHGDWCVGFVDLVLEGSRKRAPVAFRGQERFAFFEHPGVRRFADPLGLALAGDGCVFVASTQEIWEWRPATGALRVIAQVAPKDWINGLVALGDDGLLVSSERRLVRLTRTSELWTESDPIKHRRGRGVVTGETARGRVALSWAAGSETSTVYAVGETSTPIGLVMEPIERACVRGGEVLVSTNGTWHRVALPADVAPAKKKKKAVHPLASARVLFEIGPPAESAYADAIPGNGRIAPDVRSTLLTSPGTTPRRVRIDAPGRSVELTLPGLRVIVDAEARIAWALDGPQISAGPPQTLHQRDLDAPDDTWQPIAVLGASPVEELARLGAGHLVLRTRTIAANSTGALELFDREQRRVVDRVPVPKTARLLAWPKHECIALLGARLELYGLAEGHLVKVLSAELPPPDAAVPPRLLRPLGLDHEPDGEIALVDANRAGRRIRVTLDGRAP